MKSVVDSRVSDDGHVARVTVTAGRGNVLSTPVVSELLRVLTELSSAPRLKAVVLTGDGPHFSYGACVEEHLPEHAREMLTKFHLLIRHLLRYPVPVLAAVRGQCLGGGLEVALACTRIFATTDAKLGQPEVRLAVFAPAASALLPSRIGQPAADDLLITGRVVDGKQALAMRLVDELVEPTVDVAARAEEWAREHLVALAPAALRVALRASRSWYVEGVCVRLEELEELYLRETAPSEEAREGLTAFLEKRPARFQHG